MAIYGTAILSICLLVGLLGGKLLGRLVGIDANVGGVGIAMILLIVVTDRLRARGWFNEASEGGVLFWSAIYIPVVVAMAATLNVRAAVQGGPLAILAGALTVLVCFLLVPVIDRISRPKRDASSNPPESC